MTRFGPSHKAIIGSLLDGKVKSRVELEAVVIAAFTRLGRPNPNHSVWRGATTRSLKWLVENGWLHVRYEGLGREIFVIDKTKRKYYMMIRRAQERDRQLGRTDAKGVYRGSNSQKSRQSFRVLGGRTVEGVWVRSGKKSPKR